MKLRLNIIIIIISLNSFAQNTYYKVNGGDIIDEIEYNEIKEKYLKYGKIEEINLKSIEKNDSIINYIKIGNVITTREGTDPWIETKKLIGTKFPIEIFFN